MTILSEVKAILDSDATLLATATGGIWDYDETGRMGLSRTGTESAFSSGRIKPCILLKMRSGVADGGLSDDSTVSYRQVLEVWLYEDTGFANIETMVARVWTLLHGIQVSGAFRVNWAEDIAFNVRDLDLDASVERSDYVVQSMREK